MQTFHGFGNISTTTPTTLGKLSPWNTKSQYKYELSESFIDALVKINGFVRCHRGLHTLMDEVVIEIKYPCTIEILRNSLNYDISKFLITNQSGDDKWV